MAEKYQPAIIYIDEVHRVFPGKAKKKKKGEKKNPKRESMWLDDKNKLKRFKKCFKQAKEWLIKGGDNRIKIIGCTNEPHLGSEKDFKKLFDKSIFFPFPDYTTSRLVWKTFIERLGGKLRIDFPLSTLALISHQAGYSVGSIKETCEFVLSKKRVETQDLKPLTI